MLAQTGGRKFLITLVRQETDDVKTYFLIPADGKQLLYKAGQFLTFIMEHGGGEIRRSYSIISSPAENGQLAISVNRVENGIFSRELFDHKRVDDILEAIEPAGLFVLPDNIEDYKQVFFFAAGIGITPIFSIIKTLLYTYPDIEVVLLYSNRSIADTVFYGQLQELAREFMTRFRVEFLFSTAKQLSRARLSKWLLPTLLREHSNHKETEQLFYTCGPKDYMRMCLITLEELGYKQEQVKKEIFDIHAPAPKQKPADTSAHKVAIHINNQEFVMDMQYPQTILQAAKTNKISLPYSCETGRCGSCAARCVQGKVWMSYNEVLTPKDLESGKVLTCTGYPVDGDVVLDLNV